MTDIPFKELLGKDGVIRAVLRSQLQWGDWADVFCDELLKRACALHVEDLVDKFGAFFVSYGNRPGVDGVTLNVRWDSERGFSIYHGDDLAGAYAAMWHQLNMINKIKEEDRAQNRQPAVQGNADSSVSSEILPWTG